MKWKNYYKYKLNYYTQYNIPIKISPNKYFKYLHFLYKKPEIIIKKHKIENYF